MPSKRLQLLMESHNIKPLKMPPKYSRPIKLDAIEDPKVPRQIAEEMAKRNDVLEVVYFPPAQTKVKGKYRIKLKSSDEFNIFYFILLHNSRVCFQFIFHIQENFKV